jgi:ribosomal protein L12E/L44/L45/RPP1/RPP2
LIPSSSSKHTRNNQPPADPGLEDAAIGEAGVKEAFERAASAVAAAAAAAAVAERRRQQEECEEKEDGGEGKAEGG